MNSLFEISEITLSYKRKASMVHKITCSEDAFNILSSIWEECIDHVESLYVLLLNRANIVLGVKRLSFGGTAGTIADVKVLFQTALLANAHGIILAHNHPSGQLKPSQQDINLTEKVKSGSKLLDLQLLDHLIITSDNGYYSFADEDYI